MISHRELAKALRTVAENGLADTDIDQALQAMTAQNDRTQDQIVRRDRAAARRRALAHHDYRQRAELSATLATPKNPVLAAQQAIRDLSQLVEDVRECAALDVWLEIQSWTPARVTTALITACAALDPDQSLTKRLEWTTKYAPHDTGTDQS